MAATNASFNVRLDVDALKRKIRQVGANTPAARHRALEETMQWTMVQITQNIPRDTNRLYNGYAQAGNSVGLGPFMEQPLSKGNSRDRFLKRLERQLSFWQMIVERYERNQRHDKWYRQAVRTRDAAKRELEKFSDTAIVIGSQRGRRLRVTVRDKVYGGTGELVMAGGRTFYRITNREPHARLVERNTRVVSKTLAEAKRRAGLRQASRRFLAELQRGTGMDKTAAA